jgi:ATP-dependent DNA helicase DinG
MLGRWARRTETGDRAELDDLPEDVAIWSEINATSETCLGADCPQHADCFVTRMRQRAAEADLVIVNHHLLCADAAVRQGAYGEVIPECTFAVLDEAHQLEDVATQYFGVTASNSRVGQLCSDAERALGGTKEDTGDLRKDLERLRDHARGFFVALQFLRQALDGRRTGQVAGGDERVRLGPQMLADVAEPATSLLAALENVQGSVAAMKAPAEDLQAVARRAGEIRTDLAFLLRVGDADYVYFLETRGRGVFLRAAPIDVSSILRGLLFDRMQATVLTSATLTIAGSFEYARSRLGLLGGNELCLPSEFDYARQAILYLPPRMPDPRLPGFPRAASREIIEILRRTSGRAFVLFTSYSVLREVQPFAESELDYPLLVQGTAPRSALLEQFRGTPNSVLFGTSSFWQGVDVVGEALSCVIVDKLPFASPGDPITAARIESIAARGGNAFSDYQLPLAILTLQQGLGRLIRHRLDRGVLAVLDPRLKTKAYGKQFLDALPPSPVTSDLAAIETFMRG